MVEALNNKSEEECSVVLHMIFAGLEALLTSFAPDGWENSKFVHFFILPPRSNWKTTIEFPITLPS